MIFQSFAQAQSFFLWSAFGVALVMGLVVAKTNFCTMGAVSDWVNMGDTGRLRSWFLAIAVAMLGVVLLEANGLVRADGSYPPYRGGQLAWAEDLLGGLLFGVGMTLASGCGNKCLIRIGGGNLKSVFVLAVVGVVAYFMTNPFPGSDRTLYSTLFYGWIKPLAVNLNTNQDLGSMLAGAGKAVQTRLVVGCVLAAALLAFVFKSGEFRRSGDNILGGVVVGVAVVAVWYVTSNVAVMVDGEKLTLPGFVEQWDFLAPEGVVKPAATAALGAQSFTFINPMGQALGYVASGFKSAHLALGVMAVAGVIAGSLLWSLASRRFRVEWFASAGDFANHLIGAVLMGLGGVLGLGCTIGQGVTGVSTLAVGSFITFAAILAGSAGTMKFQYWRMMREA